MKPEKVIEGLWQEFMATTNLDEVSWSEKIDRALKHAITCAYGAGYDYGVDSVLYWQSKKVVQLDDYGHVVTIHPSINTAAKRLGGNASNIRAAISGRQHRAYGYYWRYVDKVFPKKNEE